jgi:hypothetical protein
VVKPKPAQHHRGGVEPEGDHQEPIIDEVIPAKTLSPQENRIDHAQAVNQYGEHEKMLVCQPNHGRKGYLGKSSAQEAFK